MIFINSEINYINLEALFFRIFKIPKVKIYFAKKITSGLDRFCRDQFLNFIKNNVFGVCYFVPYK